MPFSQRNIYEKLASALNEDERILYLQRVEEITPSIRYCAYNIGDQSAIKDLVEMRLKTGSQMSSNIDVSLLKPNLIKHIFTITESMTLMFVFVFICVLFVTLVYRPY